MIPLEKKLSKDYENQNVSIGLSSQEAEKRLQMFGPNVIAEKKKTSVIKLFLGQFSDFMVIILLISTVISALMGETTEAITIVAIVTVNAILGFLQEYKTEKTMDALKSLAAPIVKVVRNGSATSIPAKSLVPGDLILLEAGDRVAADAELIEVHGLHVDESLLTGESIPVEKLCKRKSEKNSESNKDSVFMGTIVTSGRGKAVVHSTGMKSEMGKIADMIQEIESDETPLQKRLSQLGKFIACGCLIICAIVTVTGVLRGEDLFTMLLSGISLAVAAIPEGLPAIVTISLALGVQRMLKRNALVRKLPAVESLGCASVICSDKTGTLTENKMSVREIYVAENLYNISSDRNENNIFMVNGKSIDPFKNKSLNVTLEIGVLCNDAELARDMSPNNVLGKVKALLTKDDKWKVNGDPTEVALVIASKKGGLDIEEVREINKRIDEIPFDSDRKCMSVLCKNNKNERLLYTKGAPDVLIEKCTHIMTSNGIVDLSVPIKKGIININEKMAGRALRVIGVAYKSFSKDRLSNSDEKNLIFVGLFGMIDPPRKEAIEAVRKCRLAGIKPVMITGDHRITAAAIAKELDVYRDGDNIITGAELEKIDDTRLRNDAEKISVYARVSPSHKLRIVRALKSCGHIVAMTGDGVNDAPAIKEADIGLAMGITGTDVSKEASSIVLMDDNFTTIVAAVEEGRVIYSNIRKFIRYMLSCNIGEVLTMFLGMLIGLPLPLVPIQILWVNLVTDGLPAIALGFDPPEDDVMNKHPRKGNDSIFAEGLLSLILSRGVLIGLSTLSVFMSIQHFTGSVENARTGAFATLVLTQLVHVFECKSERKNIFEISILNNIYLVISVLISFVMMLAVIYIRPLQGIFKTVPLSINDWALICGFSVFGPILFSFLPRKNN